MFFRKIIAQVLLLALLLSNVGFSYSAHYCLGMLKSERYFGWTEGCQMAEPACNDPDEYCQDNSEIKECAFEAPDCCDTEVVALAPLQVEAAQENPKSQEEPASAAAYFPEVQNHRNTFAEIIDFIVPPPNRLTQPSLAVLQRFLI